MDLPAGFILPPRLVLSSTASGKSVVALSSRKERSSPQPSNKGQPWTEEEHLAFLRGLKALGKGNWRMISLHYLPTRSPTQIASHAQKYYLRQKGQTRRRSRFTSLEDRVRRGGAPDDEAELEPDSSDGEVARTLSELLPSSAGPASSGADAGTSTHMAAQAASVCGEQQPGSSSDISSSSGNWHAAAAASRASAASPSTVRQPSPQRLPPAPLCRPTAHWPPAASELQRMTSQAGSDAWPAPPSGQSLQPSHQSAFTMLPGRSISA